MSNGQWLVGDRFAPYVEAIGTGPVRPPGWVLDTRSPPRTPANALTDPSPCDDCHRATRCSAERLACSAFALFLHGMAPRRWALAPKTDASEARYTQLFSPKPATSLTSATPVSRSAAASPRT
jgi:hypothetical protein